jgi:hypothetical protein
MSLTAVSLGGRFLFVLDGFVLDFCVNTGFAGTDIVATFSLASSGNLLFQRATILGSE